MATGEQRSSTAGLTKRVDILWGAAVLGLMGLALTFFMGPWVLPKAVGAGFAMAGIAVVMGSALALVGAYFATRGKGGLRMLLVPTPPEN